MKKFLIKVALVAYTIIILCFCGCSGCSDNGKEEKFEVTFMVDNEVCSSCEIPFGKTIMPPQLEERAGYVFKGWYLSCEYIQKWNFDADVVKDNITLYGYWLTESENNFNVLFYDGEELIANEKVKAGLKTSEFFPPDKAGYNFTGWYYESSPFDFNTEVNDDIILHAKWELIIYTVIFTADGETIKECKYTVENKYIDIPSAPEKQYYTCEWESFNLELKDVEVNAVYTPVIYTATFICDGEITRKTCYTVEDKVIMPEPPEKAGYTAEWSGLPITGGDITLTAVYTPIVYTVRFIAFGEIIDEVNYTVINNTITPPAVPELRGFSGEWEEINLTTGDRDIYAVYKLIDYKVTFIADGEIIAVRYYNIEDMKINVPKIPEKDGYTAKWEDFDLSELNDITVKAEYEPIRI